MRKLVGFTVTVLAALALLAGPVSACGNGSHHDGDWACVSSEETGLGYCQQNPIPTVDAPEEAEILPEVPDLEPIVEEYVVPLIPGKRF